MAVEKSKLNMFLMGLVIVLLLGLTGTSIYFQRTLQTANYNFNVKSHQMDLLRGELQFQVNQFEELNSTYQNLSSDLVSYTTEFERVYGSCEEERSAVKSNLNLTRTELQNKIQEVQNKITELTGVKNKLRRIRANVSESNNYVEVLVDDISDIDTLANKIIDRTDDYGGNSSCISILDDIEDYADDIRDSSAESNAGELHNYLSTTDSYLDDVIYITLKKY